MVLWTTAVMIMMMITTTMTVMSTTSIAAAAVSTTGCPAGCTCKWKNGKQTVECVDKKVLSITAALGIDPATQVLDISDNDLSAAGFPRDTFAVAGLSNLQRIRASRCNVYYVHDRAFHGLTNLVDLDLSANCLPHVPTAAFSECQSLMKLSLSGNPIAEVPANAFRHLGQLTSLDLSGCGLTTVQAGAFDGLLGLEWLKLDGNRLTHVPGPHTLPTRLHGIDLHRNNWQCDCHMADLHRWLTGSRVPVTEEPVCSEPAAYANVLVRRIPVAELACAPVVYAASRPVQDVVEGVNMSFRCLVSATPSATVEWLFGGAPVYRHNASELIAVDGNTTAELYVFNTSLGDAGTYACEAENRAGKARTNFIVTVRPGRPSSVTGPVNDHSAPSQSSSATADSDGLPLLYVACLATGSVALSITAAVFVAVRCKRAKRDDSDSHLTPTAGRKRRPVAPAAEGYRTVSTTADKEPLHSQLLTTATAEVMASMTSPLICTPAVTKVTMGSENAIVAVECNPDVVSDAKRAEWEIDFEQIVWAECPPATGYVSIQIPVQCGIECLGAYYAATAAETMEVGCNAQQACVSTFRRQHRRAAVLAAYDDTVQVRTTVQGGYPVQSKPTESTISLRAPSIVVDDPDDCGPSIVVAPIISPPLPFRSATNDNENDSIAL